LYFFYYLKNPNERIALVGFDSLLHRINKWGLTNDKLLELKDSDLNGFNFENKKSLLLLLLLLFI
jgi:hypothetical protein